MRTAWCCRPCHCPQGPGHKGGRGDCGGRRRRPGRPLSAGTPTGPRGGACRPLPPHSAQERLREAAEQIPGSVFMASELCFKFTPPPTSLCKPSEARRACKTQNQTQRKHRAPACSGRGRAGPHHPHPAEPPPARRGISHLPQPPRAHALHSVPMKPLLQAVLQ